MTNLSDTFKYISHFRHAGHQVGRKIGDMLEVLTYAAIARDPEMRSRLHVEPKLYGFSGSGHKVEFILLDKPSYDANGDPAQMAGGEIKDPASLISFIECKKVGVEQTINPKFKKTFASTGQGNSCVVPYNYEFSISFAPRGKTKHVYKIVFLNDKRIKIKKIGDDAFNFDEPISDNNRIIFALCNNYTAEVISNERSLRDFKPALKNCRILEIRSVTDDGVIAVLNDCLPGPQTPEKAKQSSFVALDVRKLRFGSFDKRLEESEMVSVLVLTEYSHWEKKSQSMIKACIDKNFVISDQLIIEAFELFENEFGPSFYNKITKDNFLNDPIIRTLALDLINRYDGKIFLDIEDNTLKKFVIEKNKFLAIS